MKRILTITAMALSFVLLLSAKNTVSAQPRVGVNISFQTFYDDLDPYGRWMDYPDYGYVWIPNAGPDFRPYSTNGHWVWSNDYEWMWVSDYDWGWAPFHYGRWFYDSFYGWVWVPGYEWSPAWVAWRDGGDYYGWAPIRPGININIGFSMGSYNPPIDYWCFTPRRYITSRNWYNYAVPRQNNVTIINNTTIINNYNYNNNIFRTGPGRRDAERYAGRITPVRFRDVNEPGRARVRGNEVSVYRPNVNRDNNRTMQPRTVQRFDRNRDAAMNDRNITRNGNSSPQRGSNDNRNTRDFGRNNDNAINDRRDREMNDRNSNRGSGNNLPQTRNGENGNNRNRDRNIGNNPSIPAQPGNDDRRGRDINDRNINRGNGNNLPQPRDGEVGNNRNRDFGNNNANDNNRRDVITRDRNNNTPAMPAQPRGNDRPNRNGNERMNMPRETPAQPRSSDRGNTPQQPRGGDISSGRNMERRNNNNSGGGMQQRREAQQPRAQAQSPQSQQPRQFERGNSGGGGQENGRRRR